MKQVRLQHLGDRVWVSRYSPVEEGGRVKEREGESERERDGERERERKESTSILWRAA